MFGLGKKLKWQNDPHLNSENSGIQWKYIAIEKTESKTIKLEPEKNILHFGARFFFEEK